MKDNRIAIAGIDYSITSPSVVVYQGNRDEPWDWKKCKAFYFDSRRNAPIKPKCEMELKPQYYPLWTSPEERYQALASWVACILIYHEVKLVYIEEYAFSRGGDSGLVFNLGENGGVLKNNLWISNIKYKTITPSNLKNYICGLGTAKKDQIENAWVKETGIEDLRKTLWLTDKAMTPISDILDAYYICKFAFYEQTTGVIMPESMTKGAIKRRAKGLPPLKPLAKKTKRKRRSKL